MISGGLIPEVGALNRSISQKIEILGIREDGLFDLTLYILRNWASFTFFCGTTNIRIEGPLRLCPQIMLRESTNTLNRSLVRRGDPKQTVGDYIGSH